MDIDAFRKRRAELLLRELQAGVMGYYYISLATDADFLGAVVIQARGETEALGLLHALCLYPVEANPQSLTIPIAPGLWDRIPDTHKWRLLNREECAELGGGAAVKIADLPDFKPTELMPERPRVPPPSVN